MVAVDFAVEWEVEIGCGTQLRKQMHRVFHCNKVELVMAVQHLIVVAAYLWNIAIVCHHC